MDFWTPPAPVYNPPIPYTGPIPGSLQDGDMVQIKGRVLPHCDRFHVNLQCGTMAGHCDVALHFNPRFECPGYVVCNSFENQHWCSEERKYETPVQKGETFQLLILVQNDSSGFHPHFKDVQVAVNDKHFLEFMHRVPLASVNTISIDGHLNQLHKEAVATSSSSKNWKRSWCHAPSSCSQSGVQRVFPCSGQSSWWHVPRSCGQSSFQLWPGQSGKLQPVALPFYPLMCSTSTLFCEAEAFSVQFQAAPALGPATPPNLEVPFTAVIPGGLFPSKSILIQGSVKPNPGSFVINLKPANSRDIALHISVRFRNEQAVVRNSFLQNSWNSEERALAQNPFVPGQAFEVTILCEAQSFRVSVNGMQAFDFKYRYQPIQQVNELQIEGDVTLSKVLL